MEGDVFNLVVSRDIVNDKVILIHMYIPLNNIDQVFVPTGAFNIFGDKAFSI